MPVKKLPYNTSTRKLFEEIIFTISRLDTHPLGAPFLADFESMRERCIQLVLQELGFVGKKSKANAGIRGVDDNIDDIVDDIDHDTDSKTTILKPFRDLFFGEKSPSIVKRPTLGSELAQVRTWVEPLRSPEAPEVLKKHADPLEQQIQAADEAIRNKEAAYRESRDFRAIGAKRLFIEELNTLRKKTYNSLDELPNLHKELKLPSDFASRFFARGASPDRSSETLEEERERLFGTRDQLREELAVTETRLAEIEAERARQIEEEAQKKAADEEIAEAERRLQEMKARRAKL